MTNIAPLPGNLPVAPAGLGGLTPGSPLTGASGGPRTSPLVRYLAAVKRVKWLVLLLTLAGLGGGYLMSRLRPANLRGKGATAAHAQRRKSPPTPTSSGSSTSSVTSIIEPVVLARRLFIKGPKRVGVAAASARSQRPGRRTLQRLDRYAGTVRHRNLPAQDQRRRQDLGADATSPAATRIAAPSATASAGRSGFAGFP